MHFGQLELDLLSVLVESDNLPFRIGPPVDRRHTVPAQRWCSRRTIPSPSGVASASAFWADSAFQFLLGLRRVDTGERVPLRRDRHRRQCPRVRRPSIGPTAAMRAEPLAAAAPRLLLNPRSPPRVSGPRPLSEPSCPWPRWRHLHRRTILPPAGPRTSTATTANKPRTPAFGVGECLATQLSGDLVETHVSHPRHCAVGGGSGPAPPLYRLFRPPCVIGTFRIIGKDYRIYLTVHRFSIRCLFVKLLRFRSRWRRAVCPDPAETRKDRQTSR